MDKKQDEGLLLVNTGDGKGKTSAAFGTVFRTLGWGKKVAMIQYVKGKWSTGERKFSEKLDQFEFYVMGKGFTWESDDLSIDKEAAIVAWEKAEVILNDDSYDLLVLDELTYIIHYNFVSLDQILEGLKNKSKSLNVFITGRNCPKEIIEISDMVTEMNSIKHPFQQGKKAIKGIDY